jgi:hypothetical protein
MARLLLGNSGLFFWRRRKRPAPAIMLSFQITRPFDAALAAAVQTTQTLASPART